MFCARCNEELQPQAKFCPRCGLQVERPGQAAPVPPQQRYTPYDSSQDFYDSQNQDRRRSPQPGEYRSGDYLPQTERQQKPASSAPLVLGIVGIIFAILLPLVTYPCSIVGLVLANNDISYGRTPKTTMRTLNIVALVLALCNSILGAMWGMNLL